MKLPKCEGVYLVDAKQFGIPHWGAAYIIDAKKKAIVETGTSFAVPHIVSGLSQLGIDRNKLDYIFITHVHLDHAGGAGFLARRYPNAKIAVNKVGAPHLIDPTYLVKSVKKAVGELFTHYGEVEPIPKERTVSVAGGEVFDLGHDFNIKAINTPGHAPHHTCFYERKNKALFAGDACGIYLKELDDFLPTTPPPSFNLGDSLDSLQKLKQLELKSILYTHFGPGYNPKRMLERYGQLLKDWVARIKKARDELEDDQAIINTLTQEYSPILKAIKSDERKAKKEITMDVKGVLLHLDRLANEDKKVSVSTH